MNNFDLSNIEKGSPGFLMFGSLARKCLGMQCQYAARYLTKKTIVAGLNIKNLKKDADEWHSIEVDENDAQELLSRIKLED